MFFNMLLQPALYIMSKLSFKTKIIASISLLFFLLLLPSRTLFTDYLHKNNRYEKQLVGLQYIEIINALIKTVQTHRTLSLELLDQRQSKTIERLRENEESFYNQKINIMNFDEKQLKRLSSNQNFAKAIALFEIIKEEKFDKVTSVNSVFKTHGQIITKLLSSIKTISNHTTFASSKDLRINYLASMLKVKLPLLNEFTKQLGDIALSHFDSSQELEKQELVLHNTVLDLKTLREVLKNNHLISNLNNYPALEEQVTNVTYSIKKLLHIIKTSIVNKEKKSLKEPFFLKKTTDSIHAQEELYSMFSQTYQDTIHELMAKAKRQLTYLIILFLIIVLIAFYIFLAFYQSITGNLKKLQTASEMITEGQTKIKLKIDKHDEIGDALIAFNIMSEKLSENISFLNGYKTAIDTSSIVSKTDTKGVITYVNKMFCDVSGYTEEELLGRSHNIIRHQDNSVTLFKDMWETIEAKKIWKGTLKNKHKDGTAYTVNATILPILDSDNNILEYVAVRHDITELEKSKEEIKKQRTDLLTGLDNRNQLLVDLSVAINPILFYINIDDFSGFNDFYGSEIGDSILIHFSKTLKELQAIETFQLYNLQADKFILLFEENNISHQNIQSFFNQLFKKIEKNISTIHLKQQNRISISISAGVATHYASDNYQNLILYADIARKKAQKSQKKFLIFEHNMRQSQDYAKNIEWIKRIKEAIKDDRIATYYQPIIDNKTGKTTKYETLVRMLDYEGIPVSTFIFLEIAQKVKLYPQITKIVISKALKEFEHHQNIEFSINLTIEDILSEEITTFIYQKLKDYPNSNNLIFEITESEEVSDYSIINNFIEKVKKYGVRIAIDDFGSGYANFEHIININADFIKIDGSLIKNITTDKSAEIITEAIISFSKKLGKKTITEYVHNEAVYEMVKKLGADYSQGFYFSEATPNVM